MFVTRCPTQKQLLQAQIASRSLPRRAGTLLRLHHGERRTGRRLRGGGKATLNKGVRPRNLSPRERRVKRPDRHPPRLVPRDKVSSAHRITMISHIRRRGVKRLNSQMIHLRRPNATARSEKAISELEMEKRKMTSWLKVRVHEANGARSRARANVRVP